MGFNTTRFGEVEVDERDVISFPEGIPGFSHEKRFLLLSHPGGGPFMWLQSADSPGLAFAVMEPTAFKPGYTLAIGKDETAAIELDDEADALVLVITGFRKGESGVSANLAAPLVINRARRLGKQFVLDSEDCGLCHDVLSEMTSVAREAVARVKGR